MDHLVDQVARDLVVDPRGFKRYLEKNASLVRAVSRR